jgi:hypothetical protein
MIALKKKMYIISKHFWYDCCVVHLKLMDVIVMYNSAYEDLHYQVEQEAGYWVTLTCSIHKFKGILA